MNIGKQQEPHRASSYGAGYAGRVSLAAPTPDRRAAQHAPRHLYLHVPFCPSICPYCDFHVLTRSNALVDAYLKHIEREAAYLGQQYPDLRLETVYFGGGTPSFLREQELEALVSSVRRHLGWGEAENTLEINPGTVSEQRARHWGQLGFDRASVGVQSLDAATLTFLGRRHSARQAREAVNTLLTAGFRVSGDLITAVSGQPLERDIHELAALGVGHISAYPLSIEPNTPFARRGVQVSEAEEERGFVLGARLLEEAGFERYEVSNYARGEETSRHNLAYWQNRFYLGLGPGAAGHYPPRNSRELAHRRLNPPLGEWLRSDFGGGESIGPQDALTDALFMGLRTRRGLDLAQWEARTGLEVSPLLLRFARYQEGGLARVEGSRVQVTEQGCLLYTSPSPRD